MAAAVAAPPAAGEMSGVALPTLVSGSPNDHAAGEAR